MKIASVVVNRNDGYKDFERGLIYFKSALESFDEVNYIDWNSPSSSFLWEIEDKLPKKNKIKHYCISSNVVSSINCIAIINLVALAAFKSNLAPSPFKYTDPNCPKDALNKSLTFIYNFLQI